MFNGLEEVYMVEDQQYVLIRKDIYSGFVSLSISYQSHYFIV